MSAAMTWEQKLLAVAALGGEPALRMRAPGDWYVEQRGVEVKERGSSVLSSAYGNGDTPQAAVEDHWRELAELPANRCVVLNASSGAERRHIRWNGYMWADLPVEASRA